MIVSEDDMRKAGEITNTIAFTNEALELAIKGTRLALAFLEGKNPGWELATFKLKLELDRLEGFQQKRKEKC